MKSFRYSIDEEADKAIDKTSHQFEITVHASKHTEKKYFKAIAVNNELQS